MFSASTVASKFVLLFCATLIQDSMPKFIACCSSLFIFNILYHKPSGCEGWQPHVVIRCTRNGWREQLHACLIVVPRVHSLAINFTQMFVLELSFIWTVNFFSTCNSRQRTWYDLHWAQKPAWAKVSFFFNRLVCVRGRTSEACFFFQVLATFSI